MQINGLYHWLLEVPKHRLCHSNPAQNPREEESKPEFILMEYVGDCCFNSKQPLKLVQTKLEKPLSKMIYYTNQVCNMKMTKKYVNASNHPASFRLSNGIRRQTSNREVVARSTSLATSCSRFLLVEEVFNVFVKQFSDVVKIHLLTIFTRSRVWTEPVTQTQCQE